MAGYLLSVFLMYSLPQLKADLPPPTLSVNQAVITESDSVTLNCQLPSSHSGTECYFILISGQRAQKLPCQQTLTGSALLSLIHQSSPVEMKLTCFYLYGSQSPQSETSPLIIQPLLPPELIVSPAVITETDSVTLNCQTPSFLSVSQCHFHFIRGQAAMILPCQQTRTGTELLKVTHQRSPARVKLTCFYLYGSRSPQSETSSLIIQPLLPPELSVSPAVIAETDSVTLNCQTPSFLSVSQCHFHFIRGQDAMILPCLQTLTGTELLKVTHQSSPAQVKLSCFYLYGSRSPQSETSSIIIRTSLPPTLTVSPPEISETDSVTLNCQPPSSASAAQCHFYTSGGRPVAILSCLQTLTGSELLRMTRQSSPAQVKLTCFYTEKIGEEESPSPQSAVSSISVRSLKPTLSPSHLDDGVVLFTCSLPVSAAHGTKCNLYFGEESRPANTKDISNIKSQKTKGSICQFYIPTDDLLSRLRSVQQRDASCDYTLGSGPNPLSPRSDRYSLTDILGKESSVTQTMTVPAVSTGVRPKDPPAVTSTKNTQGLTASPPSNTAGFVTSLQTSAKPTSGVSVIPDSKDSGLPETSLKTATERRIWKFVAAAAGCGVTVGVVLLVSAVLCHKRNTVPKAAKRGSAKNQRDDTCYYSTISCQPAPTALSDNTYSTVQAH